MSRRARTRARIAAMTSELAGQALPADEIDLRGLDDEGDEPCQRCHGDGMDPWCDYCMPCPACQGEQRL